MTYFISMYIAVCAALLVILGCSSDPELQQTGGGNENPGQMSGKVSIAYLKSLYNHTTVTVSDDIRIEGRVVSTDRQGVFYRSLCIEDETGGIVLMLESDELFKRFPYGSVVNVNCNSLRLGTYGGLLRLGDVSLDPSYTVAPVPAVRIPSVIQLQSDPPAEPLPVALRIPELSGRYLSCYISLDDVQFVEGEAGLTWCDTDPGTDNPVDTDRHLTDRDGNEVKVHISRHALFSGFELPAGSGTAYGILGYFNNAYQLVVFDPKDMDLPRF